ncbi:response regulator [Polyangium aurulentum]|uniref:response regulator n=1 Tax=Polyangium aurulentum TaxID=2567896 RepID=UPI0010ADB55D|nr:response regulator [Polyangium aurulentum]UQA55383.1 response regulator [Polyangium aurulentum]
MKTGPILIVDDSDAEMALTLRAIKKSGIKADVMVAHNGPEALDLLLGAVESEERRERELPWIVLLDLRMPGIDGLEVLKRIRAEERTRRLPVIILSSSDELSDVGACYDTGANSYIRKRIDILDFTETMRILHTYWNITERPPVPAKS